MVMVNQEPTDGLKPLREPTLFILLALSKERKHGYAILKDIERLSEGRVVLSTGTLYGALSRLLEQGLIQKSIGDDGRDSGRSKLKMVRDDAPRGTRQRKYYQLTQFGRQVIKAEVQRMEKILAAARREFGEQGA
jgi:DNA-binding PadR family transcriptional regulator